MTPAIRLKAIADECGVSVSTVSRALAGNLRISEATRLNIQRIAVEMGYHPDAHLSQLMTHLRKNKPSRSACNLGWLDTWYKPGELRQPWNIGYLLGARERAAEMGYVLDEITADELRSQPAAINSILRNRGIGGLILPQFWYDHPVAASLDWAAYSFVLLDEYSPSLPGTRISAHYLFNTRLAMEKIHALGYRRPALWISEFIDERTARADSAMFAWTQANLFPRPSLPIPLQPDNSGLPAFVKKHRPDVLIVANNRVVDDLKKLGLRVPDDIGVVHLNLADDVKEWAGIDQQHHRLGSAAVDSLIAQIQRHELGVSPSDKHISIPGLWCDGVTVRKQ